MADEEVKTSETEEVTDTVSEEVRALNPTIKRDWTEHVEEIKSQLKAKSESIYKTFISEAKANEMSEEETITKVLNIYRKAVNNLDIEDLGNIQDLWKLTEVSPIPIFLEKLEQCVSPKEFAIVGDILKKYSRNQLSYPNDLVYKWSKTFISEDESGNMNADIDGLVRFHNQTGTYFIEELVQEAYAKFARSKEHRSLMHEFIKRSRIDPDKIEMEKVAVELSQQGRFDELGVLEYILTDKPRETKYNLRSKGAEAVISYLKG